MDFAKIKKNKNEYKDNKRNGNLIQQIDSGRKSYLRIYSTAVKVANKTSLKNNK